jgi:5-deoxy-glucuronate isomerase
LAGSFAVRLENPEMEVRLQGRDSVFAGPADCLYVGPGARGWVRGSGRFAVASAQAVGERPPRHVLASQVPIELRGAGSMSREVRNFATPQALDAASLIACEVLTPAGNWSSYPPHKHDEELQGVEAELEEIYYFELRRQGGAAGPGTPVGYQRVSASDSRDIDVLAEVRSGDVVLVPFGWHGPSMAAPGYDMYYLNVMAGPGRERAWRITDHPDHAWIRGLWDQGQMDARLPFGEPK